MPETTTTATVRQEADGRWTWTCPASGDPLAHSAEVVSYGHATEEAARIDASQHMVDRHLAPPPNHTWPDDPAAWMLRDDFTSTPVSGLYRGDCYICRDPEFAQMGLPLCYECPLCRGHVPADDTICTDCGEDAQPILQARYDLIEAKQAYYFGDYRFGKWEPGGGGAYSFSERDPERPWLAKGQTERTIRGHSVADLLSPIGTSPYGGAELPSERDLDTCKTCGTTRYLHDASDTSTRLGHQFREV